MSELALGRREALRVALEAADRAGLHDSTARVLKDSDHTVVALVEAGVVAKVATSKTRVDAPEALARELDIARYLS